MVEMPMIIKLDVTDSGSIYAWVKKDGASEYPPSSLHDVSVPRLLRKLAAKIAKESK